MSNGNVLQAGLNNLELKSVKITLGLAAGLIILGSMSSAFEWKIWLAVSAGALGGLAHELTQRIARWSETRRTAGAPSRRSLALNVETWYVRNEVSANRARPRIRIFLRPIQPESGPR